MIAFSLFWFGFLTLFYFMWRWMDPNAEQLAFPAVMSLLALAGVMILVQALHELIQARKYGPTALQLDAPPRLAGTLKGVAVTGVQAQPQEVIFEVLLTCKERKRIRSSKESRMVERIKWRHETQVVGVIWEDNQESPRLAVPLQVDLPADAPPTQQEGDVQYLWQLELRADMPGVDYRSSLAVPVEVAAAAGAAEAVDYGIFEVEPQLDGPTSRGITLTRDPVAGLQLHVGPFRHVMGPAFFVLFGLVMGFAVWHMMGGSGDPFFQGLRWVFVPLFAGMPLLVGLWRLTYATTLVIGETQVLLRRGPFGRGQTLRLTRAEVAGARYAVATQQIANRPHYTLFLERPKGADLAAATYLTDAAETAWIAEQVRTALQEAPLHQPPLPR